MRPAHHCGDAHHGIASTHALSELGLVGRALQRARCLHAPRDTATHGLPRSTIHACALAVAGNTKQANSSQTLWRENRDVQGPPLSITGEIKTAFARQHVIYMTMAIRVTRPLWGRVEVRPPHIRLHRSAATLSPAPARHTHAARGTSRPSEAHAASQRGHHPSRVRKAGPTGKAQPAVGAARATLPGAQTLLCTDAHAVRTAPRRGPAAFPCVSHLTRRASTCPPT